MGALNPNIIQDTNNHVNLISELFNGAVAEIAKQIQSGQKGIDIYSSVYYFRIIYITNEVQYMTTLWLPSSVDIDGIKERIVKNWVAVSQYGRTLQSIRVEGDEKVDIVAH